MHNFPVVPEPLPPINWDLSKKKYRVPALSLRRFTNNRKRLLWQQSHLLWLASVALATRIRLGARFFVEPAREGFQH